ncbi:MAG TPA: helix-turn-helix domain-containing protein [Bauldia sp.]|nr:helix-turn-helix domain-containing protein [Bauldia sp.]
MAEQAGGSGYGNGEADAVAPFLANLVGAAFGIPSQNLAGAGRGPAGVAYARQVGMYLAHTRLHLPLTGAGALFGRDRTTAAHACRRVEESREDARLDTILDWLERAVDVRPELGRRTD